MKNLTSFKTTLLFMITSAMAVGFCLSTISCSKGIGTPLTPPMMTATTTATYSNTATPIITSTFAASFTPTSTPTGVWTPIHTATFTITSTSSPTPTGTPTSAPTNMATEIAGAPSLTLSGSSVTLNPGTYYYSCVNLGSGSSLIINGAVTIYTECFTLSAGATITGVGNGYAPTYGAISSCPGYGGTALVGGPGGTYDAGNGCVGAVCGGGGHGGAGGTYCYMAPSCSGGVSTCSPGGSAYDDPVHPSMMGSSGGWPSDAIMSPCLYHYSFGGALLCLVVYNPATNTLQPATVNGMIDMSGYMGSTVGYDMEPSGGGAGGAFVLEASTLNGNGLIQANGGSSWGGSGGGGIVSLITNKTSFTGTTSVVAGAPSAVNGIVSNTTPPTTGY